MDKPKAKAKSEKVWAWEARLQEEMARLKAEGKCAKLSEAAKVQNAANEFAPQKPTLNIGWFSFCCLSAVSSLGFSGTKCHVEMFSRASP